MEVSTQGLINILIKVAVLGTVFWILWWLISYIAPPEPFAKVAKVIIALVAAVVLIKLLLSISF